MLQIPRFPRRVWAQGIFAHNYVSGPDSSHNRAALYCCGELGCRFVYYWKHQSAQTRLGNPRLISMLLETCFDLNGPNF